MALVALLLLVSIQQSAHEPTEPHSGMVHRGSLLSAEEKLGEASFLQLQSRATVPVGAIISGVISLVAIIIYLVIPHFPSVPDIKVDKPGGGQEVPLPKTESTACSREMILTSLRVRLKERLGEQNIREETLNAFNVPIDGVSTIEPYTVACPAPFVNPDMSAVITCRKSDAALEVDVNIAACKLASIYRCAHDAITAAVRDNLQAKLGDKFNDGVLASVDVPASGLDAGGQHSASCPAPFTDPSDKIFISCKAPVDGNTASVEVETNECVIEQSKVTVDGACSCGPVASADSWQSPESAIVKELLALRGLTCEGHNEKEASCVLPIPDSHAAVDVLCNSGCKWELKHPGIVIQEGKGKGDYILCAPWRRAAQSISRQLACVITRDGKVEQYAVLAKKFGNDYTLDFYHCNELKGEKHRSRSRSREIAMSPFRDDTKCPSGEVWMRVNDDSKALNSRKMEHFFKNFHKDGYRLKLLATHLPKFGLASENDVNTGHGVRAQMENAARAFV